MQPNLQVSWPPSYTIAKLVTILSPHELLASERKEKSPGRHHTVSRTLHVSRKIFLDMDSNIFQVPLPQGFSCELSHGNSRSRESPQQLYRHSVKSHPPPQKMKGFF